MSRRFLAFLAAVGLSVPCAASGQTTAPAQPNCQAASFREFDFWVGEWTVTTGGRPAGTNVVEVTLDGCAITEHWTSSSGIQGRSLNFYDRVTDRWHQAWTDQRGGVLWMTGGLVDGRMVLQTEPRSGPGGARVVHRITWSREGGGRVRQLWETTNDEGKSWSSAFDGLYELRQSPTR